MGEEFKFHLISWTNVCTPIAEGGLGVKNLPVFNQAFLGKWLWRYIHEREASLMEGVVVGSKYGGA
jgi:hypothetical protein